MHSFCREDRGSSLMVSEEGLVSPPAEMSSGGTEGGKAGRLSSEMNWVNWECVREV
jgi:hypothetical protein